MPLDTTTTALEPHLAAFREAEELLNRALTPIACGDVLELDSDEQASWTSKQKFILLGQSCDISLRPGERKRTQDTGFLVPLKIKTTPSKTDPKAPLLPFTLRGEQWACDFRNASVARLSILDLASFKPDGRVRVDDGHTAPAGLLPAQQRFYEDRTKPASDALADGMIAGVEVKASATVKAGDFGGLRALAEACGHRFAFGVVLYVSNGLEKGPRIGVGPWRRTGRGFAIAP